MPSPFAESVSVRAGSARRGFIRAAFVRSAFMRAAFMGAAFMRAALIPPAFIGAAPVLAPVLAPASPLVPVAAAVAVLIAAPATGLAQDAVSPRQTIGESADGSAAFWSLTWPEAVTTQTTTDGREVVLRFSRPLGAAPLDKVPERLAGWVDNILFGYDAATLILNESATATIAPTPTGARVDFARKPPDKAAVARRLADDRAAERRMEYMTAAVDLEQGRVGAAQARLSALLQSDPRDVQSLRLQAAAEERLGRWRDALALSNRALSLAPADPDPARNKARLLHANGDFIRAEYDVFAVRNADTQRISKLIGRTDAGGDGSLTYTVERRRIDADQAARPDGTNTPFHGFRSAATVSYVQDLRDLQSVKISLFAADATTGAGVSHERRREESLFRLSAHWREPAYSLLEGLTSGGWRSRVFADYETRLARNRLLTVGAGVNAYGLDGEDGQLASTITVNGALTYVVYDGSPYVTVGYGLDAEYVGASKVYYDSFGSPYRPMSVTTREIHSLQGAFERPLTDYLTWSGSAGYSWDRFNKGAPFAGLAMRYEPLSDLEIGLRVSHARATGRGTADAVNAVGGFLTWRY